MTDAVSGAGFIAFAAACMARGLTPSETGNLWDRLQYQLLPASAMATQIWLEEGINQIRNERIKEINDREQS